MKGTSHLIQRHPAVVRTLAVAVLATITLLAGVALAQAGYDPWVIVGLAVSFAVIARWILEAAGVAQVLREIARVARGLLKAAIVLAGVVYAYLLLPTPFATLSALIVIAVTAYFSRRGS